MKAKTKQNIKTGFRSLISNDAVMETAKNTHWWTAVIVGIVAAFLPIIPITVSASQQYGASFLSGYTQNMETYLTKAAMDLNAAGVDFVVADSRLEYRDNDVVQLTNEDGYDLVYEYVSDRDGIHQIEFQVYYTWLSDSKKETKNIYTLIADVIENADNTYVVGTTNPKDIENDSEETEYYLPSYILLSKYGIHARIMKPDSTEAFATPTSFGDWKHTKEGTKLIEDSLIVKDKEDNPIPQLLEDSNYTQGVLNNWKQYFNESFITMRDSNVMSSTLVYYGVYLLMILFMGLMLFLLTRGKRNIFNYLKFGICLKMSAWSTITPAILGLILGFALPGLVMYYFIVLFGIRVMWMSMKQLRPQY
ncbi:MAG: hypothetical protein GXY57_03925 [Erysipelotrichaceae bacterium]|jgi:maltodextrin utilization protein YvdJ|nr:hypothetical protein [Erysipelotrichaceae bacterium]HPY79954.1 hypothetical protein [Bacilli bacterium]HQA55976.1 hypothetical protein [Bacilli bacterium]